MRARVRPRLGCARGFRVLGYLANLRDKLPYLRDNGCNRGKDGRVAATVLCIVGIACLAYGFTIQMVGSGTWFFAVWYVIGAVLLALAWALHSGAWNALPLALRRVFQVLCAAVLVVVAGTQALVLGDFNDRGEPDLDYIIVLGAQVREGGPSLVLKYRLDAAYDYLQANPDTVCIVSGGQGANEPRPEADVMAEYLRARGIDGSRILVERESLNTYQNIRNSMQLFDARNARVGIVTNNFHVYRGVHLARAQGIEHACGIAAPARPWYLPNNMLRESFGIVKDFAQGNLR